MRFFILDCFAQERYQGNELAVLVCDRDVSDREMQQIAREMNFSETAFITSGRHADGSYDARIFTPAIEVPFAGHPTLGLAHIVHHVLEGGAGERALLNLKAGQIPVAVRGDVLTMTQNQPVFGDVVDAASVVPCFGIELSDVRDDLPVQWVSTGLEAVLIPLKNLDALARCRVDHARFGTYIQEHYACNHLFFVDTGNHTLRARTFMEDPGFAEDPATGSANGNLAGYLLRYDYWGSPRVHYTVQQGVEMGRPSTLVVDAGLEDGRYTIQVGGSCVVVAEGTWL